MKYMVTVLRSGIPFGLIMLITFSLTAGWRVGIPLGLIAGLLFGVSMAIFVGRQRRHFQAVRPDFSGERLLWEGPANHFLYQV